MNWNKPLGWPVWLQNVTAIVGILILAGIVFGIGMALQ